MILLSFIVIFPLSPCKFFLCTTSIPSKINIYYFPIGPDFADFYTFGIWDIIAQVIFAMVDNSIKLVPLFCYYIMLLLSAISHVVIMLVYRSVRVIFACTLLSLWYEEAMAVCYVTHWLV